RRLSPVRSCAGPRAATPPHSDRSARRMRRTRVRAAIAAGVVAALAVGGIAGWALLRDDAKAAPQKRAAAPSTTTTTTAPKPVAAVTAAQKVPELTAYRDADE